MKLLKTKYRAIAFALLCCLLIFSLCGCGKDAHSDEEEYANFVKWQTRYEAEKELIGLLREYDAAYKWYADYKEKTKYALPIEGTITISFAVKGNTFLTDEHITFVEVKRLETGEFYIEITFDDVGADIFTVITTSNTGKYIEISENINGQTSLISQAVIHNAITGNSAWLSGGFTENDANQLYIRLSNPTVERNIKNAAIRYNDKMSELSAKTTLSVYFPASLATTPPFDAVSLPESMS